MSLGGGFPSASSLSAQTQLKIHLLTLLLVCLIDVLVAVQAHRRWATKSTGNVQSNGVKYVRWSLYALFALESAHIAILSLQLDLALHRFVGVTATENLLMHDFLDECLELGSRFVIACVGGTVLTAFSYRAYKITKKQTTKLVIAFFWAGAVAILNVTLILYAVSMHQQRMLFSFASRIATCAFSWFCFAQNVTLAWVFYKELIIDRRSQKDAVTDFAVEALSHQSPLALVTLSAAIASSLFTLKGEHINGLLLQLYSPVCLLSGLTALISHDAFRERCQEPRDDPSFWRADMSHISQTSPTSQIKHDKTPARAAAEQEHELSYFAFDLSALDKARPAVTRPSVRFDGVPGARSHETPQ